MSFSYYQILSTVSLQVIPLKRQLYMKKKLCCLFSPPCVITINILVIPIPAKLNLGMLYNDEL